MAIPASGSLALTTIQTEFGGSNPIGLNEYYSGGSYVPANTVGAHGIIPSSGAISILSFYGTANTTGYWITESIVDYNTAPSTTTSGSGFVASAVDSSGNVYCAGQLSTSPSTSTTPNGAIAKYNSNGALQWYKSLYYLGDNIYPVAVKIFPNGNIIFLLQYGIFGNATGWLICNSSGTILYSAMNTYYGQPSTTCYIDSSNNFYFTGFRSTSNYSRDVGIFKLDSTGTTQYITKRLRSNSTNGFDASYAMTVDSSGNIYSVGFISDTGYSTGILLVKCDSSGVPVWTQVPGFSSGETSKNSRGYGVVVNSGGYVYVWAYSNRVANSSSTYYPVLIKYNSSGVFQTNFYINSSGYAAATNGIVMDSSDNYYILVYSTSYYNTTILKYNSSDVLQWQRVIYGMRGVSLQLDSAGAYYIVTGYSSTVNSTVAKFPTDGSRTGTYYQFYGSYTYAADSFTTAYSTLMTANGGAMYDDQTWPSGTSVTLGSQFTPSYVFPAVSPV